MPDRRLLSSNPVWLLDSTGTVRSLWSSTEQFLSRTSSSVDDASAAYASVGWVYRCVQLRAMAIGGLPFRILQDGTEVEWPLARQLPQLLLGIEYALCLWGVSYILKQMRGRALAGLQWLNPATVSVKTDATAGVTGFIQRAGGKVREFSADQVIYHRLLNPSDDLGPGLAPAAVALDAAKLAHNANVYALQFFERGAIPAVILTTDSMLPDTELERVRSVWDKLFGGVSKSWRTAVLRAGLKPTVVGQSVKDLMLADVLAAARQQIAVAFGIPQTLLEDAANFATAREHKLSFYYETIFPEADIIAAALNEQLFAPLGLEFAFDYGSVEAVQQDEATKAAALAQLFQLGIISRDEVRAQLGLEVQGATQPVEAESGVEPEEAEVARSAPGAQRLSQDVFRELARWRKRAQRGDGLAFRSDIVPAWLQEAIRFRLSTPRFADHAVDPCVRAVSREKRERELQAALEDVFANEAEAVLTSVAKAELQEGAFERLKSALQSVLAVYLSGAVADEVLALATEIGVGIDYDEVIAEADGWAAEHAATVASGMIDTTREGVEGIIARVLSGELDVAAASEAAERMLSTARAEAVAVTELTQAYSCAERIYAAELERLGIEIQERWLTAEDEMVCPICGALDHKLKETWGQDFPDGPPAHPNCRCAVTIEVARGR